MIALGSRARLVFAAVTLGGVAWVALPILITPTERDHSSPSDSSAVAQRRAPEGGAPPPLHSFRGQTDRMARRAVAGPQSAAEPPEVSAKPPAFEVAGDLQDGLPNPPALGRPARDSVTAEMVATVGDRSADRSALTEAPAPAPTSAAAPAPLAGRSDSPAVAPTTAPLPLIFQEILPGPLTLTDEQAKGIERLQDSFVEAVGGENQDPTDPGYRARWRSQVPLHDQLLRARLGTAAFVSYQIQAAQARHQIDGRGGW